MRQWIVNITLLLSAQVLIGQPECPAAKLLVENDLKKGIYTFHSVPFSPSDNTYLFLLKSKYNIKWKFIDSDSTSFYECYDYELTKRLHEKYGQDFLAVTRAKADSLDQTVNWNSFPEFPGGASKMMQFVLSRLSVEKEDFTEGLQTRVVVSCIVEQSGKLDDIQVRRGISERIDQKIKTIFSEMPIWKPAYRYGTPVKMMIRVPMIIEFE